MALARITTQFPEYSTALARYLRSQGFEVHTCAPGESASKAADLEITLKPCAVEDRWAAIDQAMDKDMYVVVSPRADTNTVRSVEMVVLRPRAEIEAASKDVTPAQVIVMSLASIQGSRFHLQPSTGLWKTAQAKVTGTWELACALCWHVSKVTDEQVQKVRARLKGKHDEPARPGVIAEPKRGVDPELVPSIFGLSSEAVGNGALDLAEAELTPQRSWRGPLANLVVNRWGALASTITLALMLVVAPRLWHSSTTPPPSNAGQPSEPVLATAPVSIVSQPAAEVTKRIRPVMKHEVSNDDQEASFGEEVTVRHLPRGGTRSLTHPTQTVSRRVVVN